MPRYDFTRHRLFVEAPLANARRIDLGRDQANYLVNVLRLGEGAEILVFNGRDGEWTARLTGAGRKSAALEIGTRLRPQPPAGDLIYCFAPLKHARLDYLVQKAVEMGAGRLQPTMTRHTQVGRINIDRMRANAIEAAEQCGILAVPEVAEPVALDILVGSWPSDRWMIYCDEDAPVRDPLAALAAAKGPLPVSLGVLIGPEGGFDPAERELLLALPRIVRLSLGPRILRADTAAVAALALVQAVLGDAAEAETLT